MVKGSSVPSRTVHACRHYWPSIILAAHSEMIAGSKSHSDHFHAYNHVYPLTAVSISLHSKRQLSQSNLWSRVEHPATTIHSNHNELL